MIGMLLYIRNNEASTLAGKVKVTQNAPIHCPASTVQSTKITELEATHKVMETLLLGLNQR
jgi:hypothetical protein